MGSRNFTTAFSGKDKLQIVLSLSTLIPFVAVIFLGFGGHLPLVVASTAGLTIVAAAFLLAWATESMQFLVSQTFALAVLALIQVLPEYSFEVVLASQGAHNPDILHLATATMTGANRLLIGAGWPVIFLLTYLASRRAGSRINEVVLDRRQSIEVFFLLVSTAYSFLIVAKRTLAVFDAIILVSLFVAYLYLGYRVPPEVDTNPNLLHGPAQAVSSLRGPSKILVILAFLGFGGFVIFFGAEPFIESLIAVAAVIGISAFFFAQWIAPILTEFPEGVTVSYWANTVRFAPMALGNLISSKVNQWTLLVATIPIAYGISLGSASPISLTDLQVLEILLTAAQSLYAVVVLLDLKFWLRDAAILSILFWIQFFVPPVRLEVSIAYLVLAAVEIFRHRERLKVLSDFWSIVKKRD